MPGSRVERLEIEREHSVAVGRVVILHDQPVARARRIFVHHEGQAAVARRDLIPPHRRIAITRGVERGDVTLIRRQPREFEARLPVVAVAVKELLAKLAAAAARREIAREAGGGARRAEQSPRRAGLHIRARRIEGHAIDRRVGARAVEADLVRVALRAAHAGIHVARPRQHAPDSARRGRRRIHVNLRIAKLKPRRPAAPPRLAERRSLPARRLRRLAVFPHRALPDHPRRHRRRWRGKIGRARRAADLGARRPARRQRRAAVGIALRQRRPAAIGRDRPVAVVGVSHLVQRAPAVVEQPQRRAGIAQRPRERPERARDAPRRFRDHEIPARRNHRARRERIIHPARNPPVRQIHLHAHHIEKLDPLPRVARARRVVVDFVEGDDRVIRRQRPDGREQQTDEDEQENSGFHQGLGKRRTIRRAVSSASENMAKRAGARSTAA